MRVYAVFESRPDGDGIMVRVGNRETFAVFCGLHSSKPGAKRSAGLLDWVSVSGATERSGDVFVVELDVLT